MSAAEPQAEPQAGAPPSIALLDRDGTILDETGYLTDAQRVRLLPGAAAAVARLNAAGVPVAVTTNQSAIARGMLTVEGLARIHARIDTLLAEEGARVDLWLFAGYHPDFLPPDPHEAARRKPGPGMLLEALEHFDAAPSRAVTIGDSDRDLAAGEAAGVRALLVRTGKGADELETSRARLGREPEVFEDLGAAVDALLGTQAR